MSLEENAAKGCGESKTKLASLEAILAGKNVKKKAKYKEL